MPLRTSFYAVFKTVLLKTIFLFNDNNEKALSKTTVYHRSKNSTTQKDALTQNLLTLKQLPQQKKLTRPNLHAAEANLKHSHQKERIAKQLLTARKVVMNGNGRETNSARTGQTGRM